MNTSIENIDNVKSKITKVKPKQDGYYEVFFKFLPIPVEMNKAYLKTIVEDIESIEK